LVFRVNARTVLELGSELISSDIIAFYELIKNAFDAGSRAGADVQFKIALRRNDYLHVRDQATSEEGNAQRPDRPGHLKELIESVAARLDPAADADSVAAFKATVAASKDVSEFIRRLDECYDDHNSIEIADIGSGMSLSELTTNFLTLGTFVQSHANLLVRRGSIRLVRSRVGTIEARSPVREMPNGCWRGKVQSGLEREARILRSKSMGHASMELNVRVVVRQCHAVRAAHSLDDSSACMNAMLMQPRRVGPIESADAG